MNIERGITYLAFFIMIVILIGYSFGLQDRLPFYALQRQTTIAVTSAAQPTQITRQGKVTDLRELAEYQATLPVYATAVPRGENAQGQPVKQIADLRALAAYQEKSASWPHLSQTGVKAGPPPVEQIANLRELAAYHEKLAYYGMNTTGR